jgi:hypothetical protein
MTMSTRSIRALRAQQRFNSPIRSASDCWDWLTPQKVLEHALAAYYATCRRMERLAVADGNTNSIDRTVFAAEMYQYFALRLQSDGFSKDVCDYWAKAGGKLEEIDLYPESLNIDGGKQ